MRQYIAKRLLLFVPVLALVSILIFLIMRIAPGDVAIYILAGPEGEGSFTEQQLNDLRRSLGLDRPLYLQYLTWVGGLLRFDLGDSLVSQRPVREELSEKLPLTIELAMLTLFFSLVIAIPSGVISAIRQDTWADYLFRVVSIGGLTMPTFWTASIIMLGLILAFRWIPPMGFVSLLENPLQNIQQLIFPAVALGYFFAAVVARMTRSTMLEVLRHDYIRTAWAKGLREGVVVSRHALKNALLPVITISGFQFGTLLGGTVIMESIFALPGIGRALINSVVFRDYPMVQTIILLMAIWFLLINLLVDLIYAWFDPRIRYS
ncbi:MAG: ABC transporter permease [Chloroflexi bacterium]|nr:ABC transporter permease [Chloroflexota bacterium]